MSRFDDAAVLRTKVGEFRGEKREPASCFEGGCIRDTSRPYDSYTSRIRVLLSTARCAAVHVHRRWRAGAHTPQLISF